MTKNWLILVVLFVSTFFGFAQNSSRDLTQEKWEFKKEKDDNWYAAKIPGTVHTDLFQNNLIPDPFFGANEKQIQWIENENWVYKTDFIISKAE